MAISRAQPSKQVRNGVSSKKSKKRTLTLPDGVKAKPRTLSRIMSKAKKETGVNGY